MIKSNGLTHKEDMRIITALHYGYHLDERELKRAEYLITVMDSQIQSRIEYSIQRKEYEKRSK